MAGMKWALLAALGGCAALSLAACDNGPSAVAGKQAAGTQMAVNSQTPSSRDDGGSRFDDGPQVDHRKDPVDMVHGAPVWSASKKYSAQSNAEYAFKKNGQAFGARDLDDFVRKAHAFVEHPPKGTLTLTRANGDTLFYDPKANVFAVAAKTGAPRTMFKPDEGMAYWDEQKTREAKRQTARRTRNGADSDA
jgi:pyocin large subunit-like protein